MFSRGLFISSGGLEDAHASSMGALSLRGFSQASCSSAAWLSTQQIMDEIFAFLNKKNLVPACGKVYNFESICDAVAAQDGGKVNGKIVVKV